MFRKTLKEISSERSSVSFKGAMKTKRLKYNCVACRKARTKCDRSAPMCREMQTPWFGLRLRSREVGRPTAESQEQTDQLYQDAKNLFEESKKDTGQQK